MILLRLLPKAAWSGFIGVVMTGCMLTPKSDPVSADVYAKKLGDADAIWQSGNADKAMPLYQDLANEDPTHQEPWSRMAEIHFSQTHYGQAIVAAQEALQREADDRQALTVLTLSSLRIAAQALAERQTDRGLVDAASPDARILAERMRETLGEARLCSNAVDDVKPTSRKVVRRRAPARKAVVADRAMPAQAPASDASAGGSNPFGALK